jgi:hypothetical protein
MRGRLVVALAGALLAAISLPAQSPPAIDVSVFNRMTWRSLGPFRSGAATAVSASPAPGVFFEGVAGSGLWKTSDNGLTWQLAFEPPVDHAVSAVTVAGSQPAVVYAGLSRADGHPPAVGVYRSDDAGATWTPTGLETSGSVTAIAIDARDARHVWVAVCCTAAGASREVLFHSVDAGRTFRPSSLGADGGSALNVVLSPANNATLYAVVQPARSAGAAIFRSTDDGSDWIRLTNGLPESSPLTNRVLAIAPSAPTRLYATADVDGDLRLFRSDNGGDAWNETGAVIAKPALSLVRAISVDPLDPDRVVLVAGSAWQSADGGRTLAPLATGIFGAGTGAIAHGTSPGVLAIGGSQGLGISVNGGRTWSSPFTQPTADIANVITDGAFPFRVCGTQEGSGPVCVPSRVERDRLGLPQWQVIPLGRGALPDPNDPDVLYDGSGARFDRRTGQVVDMGPADVDGGDDAILAFSPDGRTMYLADRTIRRSLNAGQAWTTLTTAAGTARFSALALSSIDARTIWAGATDGTVRLSRDAGATWAATTAAAGAAILRIEPSHFDTQSAYVVLTSGARLLRTRDGGTSWQPITNGLASAGRVFVVREDPFRRGLLLAGTNRSIFVSFDDGESWRPWRLNLPAADVRDLTLRDATVVAATGGRGFWALDDMSPLRQLTADIARADAFLFRPAPAYRLRAVPRGPAAGDAPAPDPAPEGAVFSFLIGRDVRGPVTVEVIETGADEVIRRFDLTADGAATAGLHQIVWDLRYSPPTSAAGDRGPLVVPGTYQVRLTVNGRPLRQAVVVRMDPRMHVASADLTAQLTLARRVATQITETDRARAAAGPDRRAALSEALAILRRLSTRVEAADARPSPSLEADTATALARAMAAVGPQ